jgi:hypothetical protein
LQNHTTNKQISVINTKTAALLLGVSRHHIAKLVQHKRLTCLQDFKPRRFLVDTFAKETGISKGDIIAAANVDN